MRAALLVTASVLAAVPARAAELRSDDVVVVERGEVVDDDLYVFGRELRIEGRVRGDVAAFGGDVAILGPVDGDVLAAGRTVRVEGPVQGSVRVAGGSLSLGADVGRDVLAAGGTLLLAPGTTVGGDLLASGGLVQAGGRVEGLSNVAAGRLEVSGRLGRLELRGEELVVRDGARIDGLARVAASEIEVAPGARIGALERVPVEEAPAAAGPLVALVLWGRALVGLVAFGLLALLLAPGFLSRASATLRRAPGTSLAIGIAGALGALAAGLVVFVAGLFVGGWWIGVTIVALLSLAVPVSLVAAALGVGRWLLRRRDPGPAPWRAFLLGALVVAVAAIIPVLGQLALLLAVAAAFGALVLQGIEARRSAARAALLPAASGATAVQPPPPSRGPEPPRTPAP